MGKFSAYKLPLRGMARGTQQFEYTLDSEFFRNMESEDILRGNVKIDLSVNCKADYYELDFTLKGVIYIPCDRCLDEMEHEVDTTYHLCVKYGDSYNDENDELLIIPENDAYLNISYMVYDTVALTIPLKHVHPVGKCNKGMTQHLKLHATGRADDDMEDFELDDEPGDNSDERNNNTQIDPRWEALRKLTENN